MYILPWPNIWSPLLRTPQPCRGITALALSSSGSVSGSLTGKPPSCSNESEELIDASVFLPWPMKATTCTLFERVKPTINQVHTVNFFIGEIFCLGSHLGNDHQPHGLNISSAWWGLPCDMVETFLYMRLFPREVLRLTPHPNYLPFLDRANGTRPSCYRPAVVRRCPQA